MSRKKGGLASLGMEDTHPSPGSGNGQGVSGSRQEGSPATLEDGYRPSSDTRRYQSARFNHRTVDHLLMLAIPAVLFVYASTRPIARLKADMPAQFVDASGSPKQRAEEERIARAYWNCALTSVRWRYTYGSPLPDVPPAEFRVGAEAGVPADGAGPAGDRVSGARQAKTRSQDRTSQVRLRYWHRLQKAWLTPDYWNFSREWSTQWLTGPVTEAIGRIENYFSDLFKTVRQ